MLEYDFEQSVGFWLTVATQTYHRALQNELTPHGITFRQSQVLGWLMREKEMSQVDLAARMMIEAPTLAGVLDRMERGGMIIRKTCTDDRRRKLVGLTATAATTWEKVVQCLERTRKRAMNGLTDQERALLQRLLCRVHDNLLPYVNETVDAIRIQRGCASEEN